MAERSVSPTTIIRRSQAVMSADLGEETVMMDIEKGQYYGLDEVGSRIWALVERPMSIRHLCEQLVSEYEIPLDRCELEVVGFVGSLLEHDIVEIVDDAAT